MNKMAKTDEKNIYLKCGECDNEDNTFVRYEQTDGDIVNEFGNSGSSVDVEKEYHYTCGNCGEDVEPAPLVSAPSDVLSVFIAKLQEIQDEHGGDIKVTMADGIAVMTPAILEGSDFPTKTVIITDQK